MLLMEIILLLGCIILAARLGGIGVGLAGGVGMVIAVYKWDLLRERYLFRLF